ncbi:hypothetical protein Smp_153800 [Schistosoma mansoni]|uniref:hypothetical protein n=1 Tax=Schistosoma mansoni TaxID=6183 RepID=UPI0001A63F51|nr:hypothetical protein Smp_153800 [Schistosoma mansoni]|eukprot:XP_018652039.1 hypothetical protein Smp_153800 [Schistosoma mansoni]
MKLDSELPVNSEFVSSAALTTEAGLYKIRILKDQFEVEVNPTSRYESRTDHIDELSSLDLKVVTNLELHKDVWDIRLITNNVVLVLCQVMNLVKN